MTDKPGIGFSVFLQLLKAVRPRALEIAGVLSRAIASSDGALALVWPQDLVPTAQGNTHHDAIDGSRR
jgi:hypothetical protein